MTSRIHVNDHVQPKPEWRNDPNRVPTGRVVRIEPWGSEGAVHVDGEPRAFAAFVFEKIPENQEAESSA